MLNLRFASLILCALPAVAQTEHGIAPAWDIRANLQQLNEQVGRYDSLVKQLQINDWIAKGASETYRRQQEIVQTEVGHLKLVSSRLSNQPEKLSLALDAYFRLQALEGTTAALADGASRYQDQQLADNLNQLLNQNSTSRLKLRQYVMDLSVAKEQEYAVAEKEAQRCQAELNRNPLAPIPAMGPKKVKK